MYDFHLFTLPLNWTSTALNPKHYNAIGVLLVAVGIYGIKAFRVILSLQLNHHLLNALMIESASFISKIAF